MLSFQGEALREIHELLPQARTVPVAGRTGKDLVDRARAVRARLVSLELGELCLDTVEDCRRADIEVMAWTVNTPQELALARALGLVGAVTDLPGTKRLVQSSPGPA